MSLFGGDGASDPSLSPENDFPDSSTLVVPASSLVNPDLHDDQNVHTLSYNTFDAGEDEDDAIDDDSESDLTDTNDLARPNRFAGKPSTWRGYTAADRSIAISLDRIQSEDLATHLYNAHSLKRRVRLPSPELEDFKNWQGKDNWMKKGTDLAFIDALGEVQMELVPPKRWTAWPLPATEVPMSAETRGRGWVNGGDDSLIRSLGAQDSGNVLREEILAVFLKLAKERFLGREPPDGSSSEKGKRSRPGSKSKPNVTSDESDHETGEENEGVTKVDDEAELQGESERKWAHIVGEKRVRQSQLPVVQPTVLADDETARRLLRPTIDSLLGQVDCIAAGVRRTRLNHFGRGAYSDTSGSEVASEAESIRSTSRSASRARSRGASAPKSGSRPSSRGVPVRKTKKKSKSSSRGQRPHVPLDDSDSASDYGMEFEAGRESDSDHSGSLTSRGEGANSRNRRDRENSSANREASVQTGLMDWSEILGIASMSGWNERAIARTAQRCAALFGEGMAFRPFDEALAVDPISEPILYSPSTIPAPDILDIRSAAPRRPFFDPGTLRCPHTDCRHHKEDFPIPYRVIAHVIRVHGYDPRTNDSDNEERKHGGVHVDGFLQPITAKQGWLGGGRSKSKSAGAKQPPKAKKVKPESTPALPVSNPSSPV